MNRLLGHKRRFNLQHHSDNPPLFGDLWCCDEKQLHFANIKMLLRQAALSLQNLVLPNGEFTQRDKNFESISAFGRETTRSTQLQPSRDSGITLVVPG